MKVYFDNAACMPVNYYAYKAAEPFLTFNYGNPNSAHEMGRYARNAIENARREIANCINAEPDEIFFTGSGTIADNMALQGYLFGQGRNTIITDNIEHEAILNQLPLFDNVKFVKLSHFGEVDCDDLEKCIHNILNSEYRKTPIIASFMAVNNEIGTINPISRITSICHKYGIPVVVDAVQAVGHLEIDVKALDVDMFTSAGQKFGGFKGCGFLYKRKGIKIPPIFFGGGQENGLHSGTENVAGIVAMGEALKRSCEYLKEDYLNLTMLNNYAKISLIRLFNDKVHLNGWDGKAPYHYMGNLNFRIDGINGRELLEYLSENEIYVSTGSACSAGKPSHVLQGIGLSEDEIESSIRVSFSVDNTEEEVDYFIKVLGDYCKMRGVI